MRTDPNKNPVFIKHYHVFDSDGDCAPYAVGGHQFSPIAIDLPVQQDDAPSSLLSLDAPEASRRRYGVMPDGKVYGLAGKLLNICLVTVDYETEKRCNVVQDPLGRVQVEINLSPDDCWLHTPCLKVMSRSLRLSQGFLTLSRRMCFKGARTVFRRGALSIRTP